MISDNVQAQPKRPRGRPRGRTAQGEATRARLYEEALRLMRQDGYDRTTLRGIAAAAGVSPGLLYTYFPSKRAVLLQLYDDLSAELVRRCEEIPPGRWTDRALFVLEASLDVLTPHRALLEALVPALVSRGEEGVFAGATAFSRRRVEGAFVAAVVGATDPPAEAEALGRMLYLAQLALILLLVLDRSPDRDAARRIVARAAARKRWIGFAVRLRGVRRGVAELDELLRRAL